MLGFLIGVGVVGWGLFGIVGLMCGLWGLWWQVVVNGTGECSAVGVGGDLQCLVSVAVDC